MTKFSKSLKKQLSVGQQWQHKSSMETVTIIAAAYEDGDELEDVVVYYLTQEGIRSNTKSAAKFISEYSYIQPMKGAYK